MHLENVAVGQSGGAALGRYERHTAARRDERLEPVVGQSITGFQAARPSNSAIRTAHRAVARPGLRAPFRRADTFRVGGLVVRRWTRYGKDRLYVATGAGDAVGYYDIPSGRTVLDSPDLEHAFHEAVGRALGDRLELPAEPVEGVAGPQEQGWIDLAGTRPGEAARSQADAQLAAMRDRSRVGTFLARAFDVKTEERAWRVGADGEESVGARLDKLRSSGWHVLHSVPVGDRGSDIDHVVIGAGGVYTVNTKNHPGKRIWVSPREIRVDGHKVDYLRNSRFEADRARRLLTAGLGWEPPVRAVIVVLTGTIVPDVTIKDGGPTDVAVLTRADVPRAFKRATRRLTPEQAGDVYEVARRLTTWQRPRTARR